ncbi:MAG TPA: peptide ABC transporter substrate-binding protein [Chloroflexota bacterium]|nr:peptide ABC transporter substrate-binding protein [Chloroflexota bacterium]
MNRRGVLLLLVGLALAGCVPQGAPRVNGPTGGKPPATKRVTGTIWNDPVSLVARMNTRSGTPGQGALEEVVLSGLSETTGDGVLQPLLSEAVPTIENGQWQLLPDGQMTTTWRIRSGALWHDGVPFTAEDLVFTAGVDQDKELAIIRDRGYQSVESVEALDAQTVVVHWSKPYIYANTMFGVGGTGSAFGSPLPKHLLEEPYLQNKTNFQSLPFWNQQFVGTGPFKVREFVPGSHVALVANDQYVLGRPKVDEFVIRFILDQDTMIADLLAGSVDLSLGRGFSIEHAIDMRQRWQAGDVRVIPRSWITIYPQFINSDPPIVGDVRFRKALMYATDRQQLEDVLEGGLTQVAHIFLSPTEPEYKDVENRGVRYEYDPRRASQMIEQLGYAKDAEGQYRDSSGQPLTLEMRTYGAKVSDQASVAVADAWSQMGIRTEPVIVSPQRYLNDLEYMATFPSFLMYRQPNSVNDLQRSLIANTPTPEKKYVGSNYARYQNPEFNDLIDRMFVTVPRAERVEILGQIMAHISDQLNMMGLFYDADISMINKRLRNANVTERGMWNISQLDVVE